jgi:hypothetical protein
VTTRRAEALGLNRERSRRPQGVRSAAVPATVSGERIRIGGRFSSSCQPLGGLAREGSRMRL